MHAPCADIERDKRINRMNIDISGKLALVTGSTSGIGFAIAQGLAGSGAEVVVNGRSQTNVDKAVAAIEKSVPKAKLRGIAADVSSAKGCDQLVAVLPAVDILINNAGIFEPKDFFETSDEEWSRFFDVNVLSGVRLSRAYMQAMLQKNWGRIVFISSESGLQIPPEMIHYGVTKTAQLGLSRGLAELTAGTGVTVNSVTPGPTMSEGVQDFVAALAKQSGKSTTEAAASFISEHRPTSLIRRFGTVEEVASMVVYVASKQASATNGAALRVDGGVIRSIS
jgi:NAD(P)-dependent dehydrogenase (short-subunit alcohol dehydrogenase family)